MKNAGGERTLQTKWGVTVITGSLEVGRKASTERERRDERRERSRRRGDGRERVSV
jgi:hypothetical protein